jgi:SpoVK/Ycf46/Vps4 family AAA+-type ATPase
MPTTRKLAELFRAIAAEDLGGASALAAQICKGEEHKGHRGAARLLRGALSANGVHSSNGHAQPLTNGSSASMSLSTALVQVPADVGLTDVVLAPSVRKELQELVLEWRHRDRLRARRIDPRSKLLFYGPPGCGKSLTARALGRELGIPVYVVRFDAVIGAYLGQTAIHLRQLFHFAEQTAAILLLDELDALGKRRGNPLDVGELDRIVIALMQELEHSRPRGLIIGTSNLPRHLDDALWRRFDLALQFKAPTRASLAAFGRRVAKAKRISPTPALIRRVASTSSFANAESLVVAEARRRAIESV